MNTINYLGMDIQLDCPKTWDFICKANAIKGIFQLETRAAASGLKKIKPLNIDDLSLVNALNRPGSLKFLNEIAEIREGKKQIEYIDKSLKQYLEFTYGKLCYQESVLQIAQGLAGFKATESNALLKAMGKKLPEVMEKQKEAFVSGMIKNGYEKEFSIKLFSWFSDFANYSFNRCLSPDTMVDTPEGHKPLCEIKNGDKILCYNPKTLKIKYTKVKNIFTSIAEIYCITLDDGRKLRCSLRHKILCEDGEMHTLNEILSKKLKIVTD